LALIIIIRAAYLIISLYWSSTLQPIIVAKGEEFVAPSDFPEFEVKFYGEPSPGSLTFAMFYLPRGQNMFDAPSPFTWDYIVEYDLQRQQVVFAQKAFYSAVYFTRHSDDLLSYYNYPFWGGFIRQRLNLPEGGFRGVSGGEFVFLNGDYEEIRHVGEIMTTDLHEMIVLDNGNVIYLEAVTVDRAPWEEIGCEVNCYHLAHMVVEVDPDGNRVFEWNSYEYYQAEELASLRAVVFPNSQFVDVTHANAISIASDGNLLVSIRDFSEIVKVERETGEIIWRMGGETAPYKQFTFVDDPLNGFYDNIRSLV
jgi:arylsulfotransferase ASST